MPNWNIQDLRAFEGKTVRVTSTEGEVVVAKLLLVDEEHGDVVLEVKSTNQPERYERLGRTHTEAGWVWPLEFIASVDLEA